MTKIYRTWTAIWYRCENRNGKDYHRYGGRGIKVCDRWLNFKNFIEDMGYPPSPKHSIDRINNDGNYEPGNCRWATRREQSANTTQNILFSMDGKTSHLNEWCRQFGLTKSQLRNRIKIGWPIEKALKTPVKTISRKRVLTLKGETLSLSQWAKRLNLNKETLRQRIVSNCSVEQVLSVK